MPFWSTQKLLAELEPKQLIDPYDKSKVEAGHYELSLSRDCLVSTEDGKPYGPATSNPDVVIEAGQFALLVTEENIRVPENSLAFISIKSTHKLKGLVNISGFHVDPGFRGKLKFSVFNASPRDLCLRIGQPMFMIWFCDLDCLDQAADSRPYNGKHNNQGGITAEDREKLSGKLASVPSLDRRIERLERDRKIGIAILTALVVPVLLLLINLFVSKGGSSVNNSSGIMYAVPSPDGTTLQLRPGSGFDRDSSHQSSATDKTKEPAAPVKPSAPPPDGVHTSQ